MSTGQECVYTEVEPGKWMILLERQQGPVWDWREDADAYGFFPTEDAASEWLHTHFANPGGAMIDRYVASRTLDEVMRRKIAECEDGKRAVDQSSFGGGVWNFIWR